MTVGEGAEQNCHSELASAGINLVSPKRATKPCEAGRSVESITPATPAALSMLGLVVRDPIPLRYSVMSFKSRMT